MHRLIAYVIWSLLKTWYSYVASLISDSGFLFVFVHICFSRNRLLHCIALSRKLSWNRRRVYFDAIILASTLLLDFLEETLIVEKPFKKDIFLMASCLVYIGRFLFFVLAGLQAYSLALYLAKYKQKDGLYGLVALYASAIVLRLYIMFDYKKLQLLLAVWTCYIFGYVIFVEIIFGGDKPIKDNLDKAKFFGPNILKTTLCRALVIISLLSSTGRDCNVYRDLIWQLSLRMTLDLFDGVEKLVINEENK